MRGNNYLFVIMTLNKTIREVYDDFRKHMEKKKLFSIFIVCATIAIGSLFVPKCSMREICNIYISIFSSLLGFTIAALAILYSLDKENIKKLLIDADDGTKPFDVLFTSFTLSALVQLFAIVLALIYICILSKNACPIVLCAVAYISTLFSLMSLGIISDVVIHLFTIRSFLKD